MSQSRFKPATVASSMPSSHFKRAPIVLAIALVAAITWPVAHAQTAGNSTALVIDLPRQPLGDALNELARQARLQLLVRRDLVADKDAPSVSGRLSVRQALDQLLSGSGLTADISGKEVVIRPMPETTRDVSTLPAITVSATADTPLASRQERGYRSKSTSVSGFREMEVVNTPFSTATITAEVMRDQQAKSLVDVVKNDPSVTPSSDPIWYDRINVRGFYLGVNASFRDGLGINDQGSIALDNKAAIEINKGLSALRYGATSPGGTINYVVKRPTNVPLRELTASTDSHGSLGVHADLGGRFGDTGQFGYRVNLAAEEQRSHFDPFEGDKKFISGFFDWQVSDQLSLELDLEHQRLKKLNASAPSLWWWSSTEAARAAFSRMGPDTYVYQAWATEPNEQTYLAARAKYQVTPDWTVNLAVQDSKLWRDQNAGGVNTVLDASGEYEASIYYAPDQDRNNRAYQLVVEGDLQHGRVKHELAFGLDHIQRDMTWNAGVDTVIGIDNLFNPRGVARPPVTRADAGATYLANRTKQASVFITDNIIVNEQWRLFGGLRHTNLQQFGADGATASLEKKYDKSVVNPSVGLIYKPTARSTFYASYAEGIEQGGLVDDASYANNGAMLAPLESHQYEIGTKWELGSGALLTAALFQIDKGLEIDRFEGASKFRVQDGRQVHRGLEFSASGQVTPSLRLLAGFAYLDAQVRKTSDNSLIGKQPQGVPELQANLFADYALNQWLPGLSVNGGVYFGGEKAIDEQNTWMASSFVRLDAGLRYFQTLSNGHKVTYRLTIDNLTDKRYLANTSGGALQFGTPRTLRASASYSF